MLSCGVSRCLHDVLVPWIRMLLEVFRTSGRLSERGWFSGISQLASAFSAVVFKSLSGQSCSVMSSKFFAEPVSRKTSEVPKHDSIRLLFFIRSVPQLFGGGFDDAPWHGHKIIAADCSQDDARTTKLCTPLLARGTFSGASPPHSYFVTD